MKPGAIASALACAALAACSSIIEGTSQEIAINTNPAGADCALNRDGTSIAHVAPTPGAAKIGKTKDDITIVCDKDGYNQATYLNPSGVASATLGNIILDGAIGWAIDSASGADNKYDSPVNITLVPKIATQGTGNQAEAAPPSGSNQRAGDITAASQPLGITPERSSALAVPQSPESKSEPKQ